MKQPLFLLILVFVAFFISPLAGIIASVAFAVYAFLRYLPNIYAVRGNKQFSEGNTQGAVKLYKKAIKTGRASDSIKLYYALLLLRTGFPYDAERELSLIVRNKAAKIENRRQAKQYRCMVYYKQGRMDEAMEDANEAFAESKNTTTYGIMGYFMNITNAPLNELLALCEEAYEYNSDDRDIVDNLVLALIKNGSLERARELGGGLIENHPKFIEGYYHTALCEKRLGNFEAARELLSHIPDCNRTYLTTVSEEEVEQLLKEVSENA